MRDDADVGRAAEADVQAGQLQPRQPRRQRLRGRGEIAV